MQLVIQQRHRFSQVSGDSIPKKSKPRACDMPPDFETCFSRQAWKSARAHRPAIGSKAKQAGRHQIDHYLVASGSMAWSGCGPQHLDRKEDVVFMPLQIERTTGLFLMAGLEMCFQQSIGSLKTFVEDSASKFGLLQFLTVADAAPANVSMLGKLFSWLQDLNSTYSSAHPEQEASLLLACFVPCLLHQLSRVLVLNLERQQLTNKLFCVTRLVQQTPLRKSLIRILVAGIGGMAWHLLQQFFDYFTIFWQREKWNWQHGFAVILCFVSALHIRTQAIEPGIRKLVPSIFDRVQAVGYTFYFFLGCDLSGLTPAFCFTNMLLQTSCSNMS